MATGTGERAGNRLKDRPEYASKPKPLTRSPETTVYEAVSAMTDRNYGCVIVVDPEDKVIGVVTERDVMNKLVGRGLDAKETKLEEIMTRDPRVATEDDQMLDWLRMMSNERFRRLPVVDSEGRIKAVFTQGDFVSYTWPDLLGQMSSLVKAQASGNFHYLLIGGGILIYVLAMIVVLSVI
ncbi:CBS domain-containing protein [Jannaschia aquimarina]|uniref:GuaB_2 protein n=1 Tax=Jannaschia aquimarina TaxID=935700 RepID=A0A0D1ED64_9RHOB|nr:CBS domain-containing protein [Jannaschia aquimarina]KIT15659.1 Inosine-5'-monophosphate dehydrogenase [Jannaschia aquimarina]SNT03722.1 CBS domain-containing protein [Jannaschia aquimarina]